MAEQGVTVEYLGRKENYTYKDREFPCRMSIATAKALIERNPKTFKSDELEAYLNQEEQFEANPVADDEDSDEDSEED